jgi:glyoxylase-like metal-dependent hydrolase (beta-lactamase superfamily II)
MLDNFDYDYSSRDSYDLLTLYHIGALENSIHFIFDKTSKECAIVDPAWDADLFLQIIQDKGYKLTQIWLTHWHPDHTNATDELVQKTGAKVFAGVNERLYLQVNSKITFMQDNAIITLGNTRAKIINTPGHSKGGICYLLDSDFIVGDTLFVYGAGHCSLPGGSIDDFYHSMQKIKKIVPNEVYLRCGHDYGEQKTTTMAEQKQYNAYLLLDEKSDLVRFITGMANGEIAYPTTRINKQELLASL